MATTEMTVHEQAGFLAPVVSVANALAAFQAKKELVDGIMKEGVDFGKIPGSSKPTLYKAGAEKATSFFGLCPRFVDAGTTEDWTGQAHNGEPFFYYRRTCNLYKGNVLVASVDGSCNSWEKKYRYRWVDESNIPANVDKSKLKTQGGKISEFEFALNKAETTGKYGKPAEYWKRFQDAIANGTARSFKRKTAKGDLDAWEIDGTLYCLPNEDPADIVNTVLKMADKRALVAATLIATGMSEYFTQDIEDYVPTAEVTELPPAPAQQKPAAANGNGFRPAQVPETIPEPEQPPESEASTGATVPGFDTPLEGAPFTTYDDARKMVSKNGEVYDNLPDEDLLIRLNNLKTPLKNREAARVILAYRKANPK